MAVIKSYTDETFSNIGYIRRYPHYPKKNLEIKSTNAPITFYAAWTGNCNWNWGNVDHSAGISFIDKNTGESYNIWFYSINSYSTVSSSDVPAGMDYAGYVTFKNLYWLNPPENITYVDVYVVFRLWSATEQAYVYSSDNSWLRIYTVEPTITVYNPEAVVSYNATTATFNYTYDTEQILSPYTSFRFNYVPGYITSTQINNGSVTFTFPTNTSTGEKNLLGSGINLLVDENYDGTIYTISSNNIKITQKGAPYITVSPTTMTVGGSSSSGSWTVSAYNFINPVFGTPSYSGDFDVTNVSKEPISSTVYSYTGTIPEWSASSGTRSTTMTFRVTESGASTAATATCVITQNGEPRTSLVRNSTDFSNVGGNIPFTVNTNIANPVNTFTQNVDWLSVSGNNIVAAPWNVAISDTIEFRTGTVTLTTTKSTDSSITATDTKTFYQYKPQFLVTRPSSDTMIEVKEAFMSDLNVSIRGITGATIELDHTTTDRIWTYHYYRYSIPANPTTSSRTATITATATNLGTTYTKTLDIVQDGTNLQIDPQALTVNGVSATFNVYARDCTPNNFNLTGNITVSSWNYDLISTVDGVKTYLLRLNLVRNTGSSNLVGTITPTDTVSGYTSVTSATITQLPSSEPSIVINPSSFTIESNVTTTAFNYSAQNASNLTASISGSGSVFINTSNNTLNITIPVNTGNKITRTITLSGVSDTQETVTGTATLIQNAPAATASLVLSPSRVSYNGGTSTAVVTTNVQDNTTTITSNQEWAVVNDTTITVSANPTDIDRTATITATVVDNTDATRYVVTSATLVQGKQGGYLTISPASQVIDGVSAQFNVYAEDCVPTDILVNGDIVVTNFVYEYVDVVDNLDHYNLYLTLAPNSGVETISGQIIPRNATITGTSATLQQRVFKGLDVSPESHNFEDVGGTFFFDLYTNNINLTTLGASIDDTNMDDIHTSFNSAHTQLAVICGPTTSGSQTSATITVSAQTLDGESVSKVITVTQDGATPYIVVDPKTQTVSSSSGNTVISVTSSFGIDRWEIGNYSGDMIINTVTPDYSANTVTVIYGSNNTVNERTERIVFNGINNNEVIVTTFATIVQESGLTSSITPVWKDVLFRDTVSSNFIEYHIENDGNILYSGKVYKMPDESSIVYSVNDVVSNYLGNGLVFTEGIQQIPNYAKEFYIRSTGANHYLKVYNSWAYEDTNYWLSDPIDYRVSCKQWLPVSFLSTTYSKVIINHIPYNATAVDDGWTAMVNLSDYNLGTQITVGGANETRHYKIADGDYVLYYANAFGGWDSLLCNATSRKSDNIETLSYKKKTYNRKDFSKIDYQKNITPTWTMNTGIIKSGDKMYHLLESTMVYLHRLDTNEIIPVVITNSTCDYLNYTNNGKRPCTYQITVEESNAKIRK